MWVEKFVQNQINLKYIAKYFKYLPKQLNFAKSGHTVFDAKLGCKDVL